MSFDRKKISNAIVRRMNKTERGTFLYSCLGTLRLILWTLPYCWRWRGWLYFGDTQLPYFLKNVGRDWVSERRSAQRTFGTAKPNAGQLMSEMTKVARKLKVSAPSPPRGV